MVYWLQTAGQSQLVGAIVERSLVREIAPVVVGFIIFGRAGTRSSSTWARRGPRDGCASFERQGIDPIALLVMPRMTAHAIGAFCLSTILLISTLVTGYLVASVSGAGDFPDLAVRAERDARHEGRRFHRAPRQVGDHRLAGRARLLRHRARRGATNSDELQRLVPRGFVRSALAILVVNGLFDLVA